MSAAYANPTWRTRLRTVRVSFSVPGSLRWTNESRAYRRKNLSKRLACTTCAVVFLVGGSARSADTQASPASKIDGYVEEASARFGIPASWIASVMRIESGGHVLAVSPKGAVGLMQIMPRTWADLRDRYKLGADPFDPQDNVAAGAAYLRLLLDRYGSPGFLAAYNAGPGRYEDHLATGRPLPAETTAYVASIEPSVNGGISNDTQITRANVRPWTESPLFMINASSVATAPESPLGRPLRRSKPISSYQPSSVLRPRSGGLFATRLVVTGTP